MSHQGTHRLNASEGTHQGLARALARLLPDETLDALAFREGCTWTPRGLIYAALLWAWSAETALTDRFTEARATVIRLGVLVRVPAVTYQAFLKLLAHWTATLAQALADRFRDIMTIGLPEASAGGAWRAFAVDGTRLELPRTASHERAYAPRARRRKRRGAARRNRPRTRVARQRLARYKKGNTPSLWLTSVWDVATGLPWDWRSGPSDSSERAHLAEMLDGLPAGALVMADAGFAGYELWHQVLSTGRNLLVRVGANVRLIKKLGTARQHNEWVALWPDRARHDGRPPLWLRLVVVQDGRHPVYLVTSVYDRATLPDPKVAQLYGLRWGIEVFFRTFKQTFARRKLRSHAADNAALEVTWSLLGLWAMTLRARQEQARVGLAARRCSAAKVLRTFRTAMRGDPHRAGPGWLASRLAAAVVDCYVRHSKASRGYPRKKYDPAPSTPHLMDATPEQRREARQHKIFGIGLTA